MNQNEIKFCHSCGEENRAAARYCAKCGVPMPGPVVNRRRLNARTGFGPLPLGAPNRSSQRARRPDLCWSRDGARLLVSNLVADDLGSSGSSWMMFDEPSLHYYVNVENQSRHEHAGVKRGACRCLDSSVCWSPEGEITYASEDDGQIHQIGLVNDKDERLTSEPALALNPQWSPNGSQLAFAAQPDSISISDRTWRVLDLATRQVSTVGEGEGIGWSPSGTRFAAMQKWGNPEISVFESGSSTARKIKLDQDGILEPLWMTDQHIAATVQRRAPNSQEPLHSVHLLNVETGRGEPWLENVSFLHAATCRTIPA